MSRPIYILAFPILCLILAVASANAFSQELKKLQDIRTPTDYFAETRNSAVLWPEKILCFTRKNKVELNAEPLHRHHHHRYVLVVPWQGTGEVFVDERRFQLECLRPLLIFPFQFHHGFNFDQERVLWLFITFEVRDASLLESLRLQPLRSVQAGDMSLLQNLVDVWKSGKRTDELAHWLGLFLTRMLDAPPVERKKISYKKSPKDTPLLIKINQLCVPNLHLPLGIKELAVKLAISESHLRARFRNETKMSLGQHLRRLRLQKSIGLLLQSELSISQVAERCGFDSVFTFSRSFRHFTGVRARDYRKRFSKA